MILKSSVSYSTRSIEVTLWEIVTWKFLYTHLGITRSALGLETESFWVVAKERVDLGSNNA